MARKTSMLTGVFTWLLIALPSSALATEFPLRFSTGTFTTLVPLAAESAPACLAPEILDLYRNGQSGARDMALSTGACKLVRHKGKQVVLKEVGLLAEGHYALIMLPGTSAELYVPLSAIDRDRIENITTRMARKEGILK